MAKTVILFHDPADMSRELATAYVNAVSAASGRKLDAVVVPFTSSKPDNLALISKHRVVAMPTVVVVGAGGKVLFRCSNTLPTPDYVWSISGEA